MDSEMMIFGNLELDGDGMDHYTHRSTNSSGVYGVGEDHDNGDKDGNGSGNGNGWHWLYGEGSGYGSDAYFERGWDNDNEFYDGFGDGNGTYYDNGNRIGEG